MSIGDWDPIWLGPISHRLYAAMHGVPGTPRTGAVLVPPLLHELPRSRRFLVEVASELAAKGVPCLRFDFHGTGDSHGRGTELDFASMQRDLDLAVTALREQAGVTRVAVLAWRGSALALPQWLDLAPGVDLVVLWEPILDGACWLRELMEGDASERDQRPPPRKGVPRLTDPADGQLMGFPASSQLRGDLAQARTGPVLSRGSTPVWAVVRSDASDLALQVERVMLLPASAPSFSTGAAMDATFFLTPQVRELVGELGQAVGAEAWA